MMSIEMMAELVLDSAKKLKEIRSNPRFDPMTRLRLLESEFEAVIHVLGKWFEDVAKEGETKEFCVGEHPAVFTSAYGLQMFLNPHVGR